MTLTRGLPKQSEPLGKDAQVLPTRRFCHPICHPIGRHGVVWSGSREASEGAKTLIL